MGNAMAFLDEVKKREKRAPSVKFDEDKAIREFRVKKSSKLTKMSICECCEKDFAMDKASEYGASNQQNCPACRGYGNTRKRKLVKAMGSIRSYEAYIKEEIPYNILKSSNRKVLLRQAELRKKYGQPYDFILGWADGGDRSKNAR